MGAGVYASSLAGLPADIVLAILYLLPHTDILRCQAVNKVFNELIRTSTSIQYTIQLAFHGYLRNPTELASEQCLRRLQEHEESWRVDGSTQLRLKHHIPLTNDFEGEQLRVAYHCYFDTLFFQLLAPLTGDNWETTVIRFADLSLDLPRVEWWKVPFTVASGMFYPHLVPCQDLLILAPYDPGVSDLGLANCTLHFFSLIRGVPHPKAKSPLLISSQAGASPLWGRTNIQVHGPSIVFQYTERHPRRDDPSHITLIGDWTAGVIHRVLAPVETSPEQTRLLSPDHLLVGVFEMRSDSDSSSCFSVHTLQIVVHHDPTTSGGLVFSLKTLSIHELPPLAVTRRLQTSLRLITSAPLFADGMLEESITQNARRLPFVSDPLNAMVAMEMNVRYRHVIVPGNILKTTLATTASTFLTFDASGPTRIPWASWGPSGTAHLPNNVIGESTGSRYISAWDARVAKGGLDFRVVDLNRNRVRKLLSEEAGNEDDHLPPSRKKVSSWVVRRQVVPNQRGEAVEGKPLCRFETPPALGRPCIESGWWRCEDPRREGRYLDPSIGSRWIWCRHVSQDENEAISSFVLDRST